MKDISHHSSEYNEAALAMLAEDVLAMKTDQLEPFVNDLMRIVKERRENEARQRVTDLVKSIHANIEELQTMGYCIAINTECGGFFISTKESGIVVTATKEAH